MDPALRRSDIRGHPARGSQGHPTPGRIARNSTRRSRHRRRWLMVSGRTGRGASARGPNWLPHAAGESWLNGVGILASVALVGYVFKPLALESAETIARLRVIQPLLALVTRRHYRKYATKMSATGIRLRDLRFPFDALHANED